ncbi:gene transfer agent family protein [Defluviimonas sp. D31]|uniref:gene transfer agent family protein n=1 Tax=Defluviimonas sp. D31 TaxID=3083253 RepID=UPI00296FB46F|nr:gene transfer agent family protein [Defluviimonas sp. D31]MDW4548829.1 gene transfer agent family protein [Defluviimonas sp. D31]
MISHTAFFGDRERTFALTDEMIRELERLTGVGIGALYLRAVAMQFAIADIVEVIRLGLIGGGATPEEAQRLTHTYARRRPIAETFPLALDILDARWNGTPAGSEVTA